MISKSLTSLLNRAGRPGKLRVSALLGSIIALGVPLLSILLGGIFGCLLEPNPSGKSASPSSFVTLLPDPGSMMPNEWTQLAKVSGLLVTALIVLLVMALLLYAFYRQIQSVAVEFEVALIEKLRHHAKRLATVRTLSAQQQALTDCLDYHLPRVRSSLSRWWRTSPRHFVQLLGCVLVASLIQPMLALLTLIAIGLVVLVYRFLDRSRRTTMPVVRERAAQQRGALVDLSLKGPLLESVHDEHEVERRFSEQLAHYRQDAVRSLTSAAWKTPMVLLTGGALACLFLFVISVQVLRSDTSFSMAGVFAFSLCIVAAALSAVRVKRAMREVQTVETAADELERFLALRIEEFDGDDLKEIDCIKDQAELEHVTVQDSNGRKLLEDASVTFRPGQLIGVVASQRLQAHALVELLMGFGRPVSGRMLVDDILVSDLKPDCLSQCSHWVAEDGALVTGSVRENLVGSDDGRRNSKAVEIVDATRLSEAIQQLPDGLATIITPGDDRLTGDAPFRIGIARAALTDASVIVVEEPGGRYDQEAEQQTLAAIRSLVKHTTISVVLPQRLSTLRQCDMVVMLHDHTVVDTGTHAELLQRNELYRHLNYLKFNPFRGMPQSIEG